MKCPLCFGELPGKVRKCQHCGDYVGFWNRVKNHYLIPVMVGVIIGAMSFNYGQSVLRKENQKEKEERYEAIISFLQTEFDYNYHVLSHNDEWLKKNKGWLEKERRDKGSLQKATTVIIPLRTLKFIAWENAQYNLNFLTKLDKNYRNKLIDFYFILEEIDTMIKDRESYRISNARKDWYALTVKNLDNNLMIPINNIEPIINEVGDLLYGKTKWKEGRRKFLW